MEAQGPFDLIIHKVTDILARANDGHVPSKNAIANLEVRQFFMNNSFRQKRLFLGQFWQVFKEHIKKFCYFLWSCIFFLINNLKGYATVNKICRIFQQLLAS